MSNPIDDVIKRFDERFPCINSSCNNNGTLAVGNYGTGLEPEQCQYCYQERFPFKSFLRTELESLVLGEEKLIEIMESVEVPKEACTKLGLVSMIIDRSAKAIADYQRGE